MPTLPLTHLSVRIYLKTSSPPDQFFTNTAFRNSIVTVRRKKNPFLCDRLLIDRVFALTCGCRKE
jgi:hypothetical protein